MIESTEFGRSLPSLVASATALRISSAIHSWSEPRGRWISKNGIPVSWQMGPSTPAAWSMLTPIIESACPDRVSGGSRSVAAFIAARTSGGSSVDVLTISSSMLEKNSGNMGPEYTVFHRLRLNH